MYTEVMNSATTAHVARIETIVLDGIAHEFIVCDDTKIVGTSMILPDGDVFDFGLINRRPTSEGTTVQGRIRRTGEFAFATFVNVK